MPGARIDAGRSSDSQRTRGLSKLATTADAVPLPAPESVPSMLICSSEPATRTAAVIVCLHPAPSLRPAPAAGRAGARPESASTRAKCGAESYLALDDVVAAAPGRWRGPRSMQPTSLPSTIHRQAAERRALGGQGQRHADVPDRLRVGSTSTPSDPACDREVETQRLQMPVAKPGAHVRRLDGLGADGDFQSGEAELLARAQRRRRSRSAAREAVDDRDDAVHAAGGADDPAEADGQHGGDQAAGCAEPVASERSSTRRRGLGPGAGLRGSRCGRRASISEGDGPPRSAREPAGAVGPGDVDRPASPASVR